MKCGEVRPLDTRHWAKKNTLCTCSKGFLLFRGIKINCFPVFPIRGKIPPVACGSGFGVERGWCLSGQHYRGNGGQVIPHHVYTPLPCYLGPQATTSGAQGGDSRSSRSGQPADAARFFCLWGWQSQQNKSASSSQAASKWLHHKRRGGACCFTWNML